MLSNEDREKKEQAEKVYKKASRRAQIYRTVFATDEGKFVLHDLMKNYRFFRQVTVAQDHGSTEFLDGQRSVVLGIYETITKKIEEQIELLQSLPTEEPPI